MNSEKTGKSHGVGDAAGVMESQDAELRLAHDPQIYRRSFLDSTDAIVITDLRGRIVDANPAWQRLYGYPLDEVRGRTTSVIQSRHTNREVYEEMWSQILDPARGSWTGELVNRKRSGEEVPVLLTITPIRSDGGEHDPPPIVGYMGVAIDISERKQLEELRELYDTVVRHDLKAPLASMITMLQTLLGGYTGELAERQRTILERVLRRGRQMQEIIATSLDIEKLRRRRLSMDYEDVDVLAAIRSSFETMEHLASRHQVELLLTVDGREPQADESVRWRLDPVHTQRCTDNLIKNAVEASPAGEPVVVRLQRQDLEGAEPQTLQIAVHNGGDPIPAHVRATLFHPFSTYGKRGGTGLGIYGVKLTVEAMGGSIDYESGEQGTTFTLRFGRGEPRS